MDGELVSDSPSELKGEEANSSPYAYSEVFDREFPYYLAMGMSYDEYWNQDPNLVRAYRKAERLKEDGKNRDMWLQGMYFYEALCDASPLYHDFAKKGTKAHKYSDKPYDLHPAETARKQKRASEKKTAAKGLCFMQAFMTAFNSKHTGGETVAER